MAHQGALYGALLGVMLAPLVALPNVVAQTSSLLMALQSLIFAPLIGLIFIAPPGFVLGMLVGALTGGVLSVMDRHLRVRDDRVRHRALITLAALSAGCGLLLGLALTPMPLVLAQVIALLGGLSAASASRQALAMERVRKPKHERYQRARQRLSAWDARADSASLVTVEANAQRANRGR